ncbi:hypothetical protein DFQ05_0202 [Winogradskyella wandonensis]|uniref:Uncharacterized protein n=2 Tax=Winogradskyella TaxID=286104 RepID=A0A4R1KU28_9FLAO|nr:hypothetical protein DFQ05_0202 [Winogradskyella wandonensis]SHH32921.1 hypothetical protein SAMN05444148_1760 [Winogradskyella jejuensis]
MHRLLAILAFYKPFVVWSFVINAIIGFFNPHLAPALITKLFLTVFAWYYVHETSQRRKLTFYKNLGISPVKLFSILFLIDSVLTIIFLTIFKEFT